MNKISTIILIILSSAFLSCSKSDKENEPWSQSQLMEPSDLAQILKDTTKKQPLIIDIGFFGGIKNSIRIGPAREKANVDKLREFLNKYPKDADIVIYCGCCPFKDCPNIRPAFNLIKELNFSNAKLLDLPHNLKTDWSDKGYPLANQ
jgi:thiosulfate/3-mercaptopyruvate sulfurtransferase